MKNITFLLSIAFVLALTSLFGQAQDENILFSKIKKTENNNDIIEYVVDFPQGAQIQEVENMLFKKCVKHQKEKDCATYLDLFSEEGQYVDQVMGILDRILEEKAERNEKPEIFEKLSSGDLLKGAEVLIRTLGDKDKSSSTKSPTASGGPTRASGPKTFPVNLTFGASNIAKVYINGKEVSLKKGPKGKSFYGSFPAGEYALKVVNTAGQVSCIKLLKVTKAVAIVNPCLSLPNYPSK